MLLYCFCLLLSLTCLTLVNTESFLFPADTPVPFIEGDLVNVTWNVVTPRLSLFEVCGYNVSCLETNMSNTYSYLWMANRDIYHESGCVFELESLGPNGVANPPNISSPLFGVNKRYSDDPLPTLFNGYTVTPTATLTLSSSSSTSPTINANTTTTSISTPVPDIPTTSTSSALTSHSQPTPSSVNDLQPGLSVVAKLGLGVGIFCLLLFISGTLLLYSCRRRLRSWARRQGDAVQISCDPIPWMARRSRILDCTIRTRVPVIAEMEGSRPIFELMGTPRSELC